MAYYKTLHYHAINSDSYDNQNSTYDSYNYDINDI